MFEEITTADFSCLEDDGLQHQRWGNMEQMKDVCKLECS